MMKMKIMMKIIIKIIGTIIMKIIAMIVIVAKWLDRATDDREIACSNPIGAV